MKRVSVIVDGLNLMHSLQNQAPHVEYLDLVELAKRLGAHVIATTGSADKVERLRQASDADAVILAEGRFREQVAELTGGRRMNRTGHLGHGAFMELIDAGGRAAGGGHGSGDFGGERRHER